MFWDCCHFDLFSGLERLELGYPSLGLCLSAQHFPELLWYFIFLEDYSAGVNVRMAKPSGGSLGWFI